ARVRPLPPRRDADARRRGAHPRLEPVLVRGRLRPRAHPAEPGQAVRARLADLGRLRLAPRFGHCPSHAPRRGGRADPRPLRRGLRTAHRRELLSTGPTRHSLTRHGPPHPAPERPDPTRLDPAPSLRTAQVSRRTAVTAAATPRARRASAAPRGTGRHTVRSPSPRPRDSRATASRSALRTASTSSANAQRSRWRGRRRATAPWS